MTPKLVFNIIEKLQNHPNHQISNWANEVQWHEDYAEPGYSCGKHGVVTGNWNNIDEYDPATKTRRDISDIPERLSRVLEKLGVEIEWSDEWTSCSGCYKIVRTSGDSYSWQPSYVYGDGEIYCHDCISDDPDSHLESLEDNPDTCNTIEDIDPADYGYVKVNEDSYETGWHPGQTDSPHQIAKDLRAKKVYRFLFNLDENSQFYSRWSVYVHKDEIDLLKSDDKS